ncbi:hypothetical protein [Lysinibacter sp. HNR]|uniref:hypothetical protein n=1 Tax=Lysinibacter sp. HNR TaxID=3031408 RepID=UPI0024356F77|nr:hypothetical protein [Lysinibacter sp. HNR]WGD38513.1 hypothetical protein FrondiHNR_06275 [Lysinibacter sp. HNR]
MTEGSRRKRGRIIAFIAVIAVAAIALLGYINRQYITDQVTVWTFTPSSEVVEVKDRLNLTDRGEFVFLASSPTLESSQLFNEQCSNVNHGDGGHVLGCFTGENIHLFKIDDERLNGVVEVTAAHELLHAAYSRLSDAEKEDLNRILLSEYERIGAEKPEIKERMAVYDQLTEAQFVNELHSVLGTEVSGLSAELEEHYATYFTNRQIILDLFNSYHSAFTSLQSQAQEIEAQMRSLGDSIESRRQSYEESITTLNATIAAFNDRAQSGSFSSQAEFQSERNRLLSRADALEAERTTLESDVSKYNELRQKLIALGAESQELNRVLDSNLAPAPSL